MTIFKKISLVVFILCLICIGYSIYGMNTNKGLFHTKYINYEYGLTTKQLTDNQIIYIREYLAKYKEIDIPILRNDYKNYTTPTFYSNHLLILESNIPLKYIGKNYGGTLAPIICGVTIAIGFIAFWGIIYKEE